MVRASPQPAITNRLLDRLPAKERARVLAACAPVKLAAGETLARAGDPIRHVYFPTVGFISLLVPMVGDTVLEVALAGDEGMCGVPIALGVSESSVNAVVQGTGSALRMGSAAFRRDLARFPAFRASIDLYIHVLMTQLVHTAGCNRYHVVEQRVARWLLMTSDRAHSSIFPMTHELLAHMLGVRRVGVTEAAGALQARKLIGYTRGMVTIVDRKGMERAACSCYAADRIAHQRVLG